MGEVIFGVDLDDVRSDRKKMFIRSAVNNNRLMALLYEYRIINSYFENVARCESSNVTRSANAPIHSAFDWYDTPEGYSFWSNIALELEERERGIKDD